MRPVAIVGIGKTPFGAFADRDLRSLAVEAGEKCLHNGHVEPAQVESFYLGNFAGPSFVGQNHLALRFHRARHYGSAVHPHRGSLRIFVSGAVELCVHLQHVLWHKTKVTVQGANHSPNRNQR